MKPLLSIVSVAVLASAGLQPKAHAQVFDFGQIEEFESLGSGTQKGGSPPKTIVDDSGRHTVLFTIMESNTEAKIYWRSKDGSQTTIKASDSVPYAAFVWKTIADPFAGRITMLRVLTGTLKSDATVGNLTNDTTERLDHLLALQGKNQTHVAELKAAAEAFKTCPLRLATLMRTSPSGVRTVTVSSSRHSRVISR